MEGMQCAELIAARWWLPGKAGDSQKVQQNAVIEKLRDSAGKDASVNNWNKQNGDDRNALKLDRGG